MSSHSSFHTDTPIFNLLREVLGDEATDSSSAAGIPWWQLLGDNSHVKGFLHPQYRSETEQSELGPNAGIDYWPILHIGTDYTVRELGRNRVLTLTCFHQLAKEMGERPFDIPLLGKGRLPNEPEREIIYFVQAQAEGSVTREQSDHFFQDLAQRGYQFVDPGPEHLGIYQGRVVLLVPWVVCLPRPVSVILREITDEALLEEELIDELATTLEHSAFLATRVVLRASHAVILELQGGNLLNITNRWRLQEEMGSRPFDAPMLDRGCLTQPRERDVTFFIHPPVEIPVTREQHADFQLLLKRLGYRQRLFGNIEDLGIYEGQVVLLDPWAVIHEWER